jgi:hypothetical protein
LIPGDFIFAMALPSCPFCGTKAPHYKKRFTTGGILMLLFGLVLTPIGVGLILIIISLFMREAKYDCPSCRKRF